MVGLAIGILVLWGLSLLTAVLVALLLVCPAILLWGVITMRHCPEVPLEPVPETRGMTLNWTAPFYDWYCPKLGLGQDFRRHTLCYAALQPGERVLDVGCGTGVVTRLAAEVVGPAGVAIGIDPAVRMIAMARQNARRTDSRAVFKLAAIEHLPFEASSFDITVASFMLHHLPSDLKTEGLREVYRVLKPGGRLLVVDLDRPANALWWLVIWPLLLMPTVAANIRGHIPEYLRQAGFVSVQARRRWWQLLTLWVAVKPSTH
jgi:ubiquinone/menaquinone biosynthesis C-methylase UbiE